MARALGWLALVVAYIATLFYIAAMVTPWWYTKYYPVGTSDDAFYDANPGLDQHTGLFRMTNCFIDGSCITGGQIYKNNSSLQWVYTAVLVLMILGWIPWLIFVHLLHFRNSKNPYRANQRGLRPLMFLTALATFLLILAAFIVFAAGIVKTNGVYNSGGLYGHKQVLSSNGLIGTGGNIDDSQNKRSEPLAINSKRWGGSGGSGGSGGTGPILPPSSTSSSSGPSASETGTSTTSTTTSSPATTTTSTTTSTTTTTSGVIIIPTTVETTTTTTTATSGSSAPTPPQGESGTAGGSDSGTGSSSTASTTSSTSTSGTPSTTVVIPPSGTAGDGNDGESNDTFGYPGRDGARDLNLYWDPHAWGTLPYGNQGYTLLGAGIPVLDVPSVGSLNGTIGYKYGANAAWYFTLLALALIPLALILGLCLSPVKTTATQTTSSTTASQSAVIPPVYNPSRVV